MHTTKHRTRLLACAAVAALALTRPAISGAWAHRRAGVALAWVGIGLVLTSAFVYDDSTPFPGFAAALPVVGTALALAAGVAVEDLTAADLNGDGRIDLIAVGRKTKNLRVYWNEGRK